MTIDPVTDSGFFRSEALDALDAVYDGEFLRCVRFEEPLTVCVDGKSNKGVVKHNNPLLKA